MESAIDMCRSFFNSLNGKQYIPVSYTVFITKGSRETRVSKTEKTYFKLNMANPVNILYSELLSQQRVIYLRVANNT